MENLLWKLIFVGFKWCGYVGVKRVDGIKRGLRIMLDWNCSKRVVRGNLLGDSLIEPAAVINATVAELVAPQITQN